MAATARKILTDESWRLSPWQFAQRASYGRFIPYRHVRIVCDIIAREIIRGGARIIINWPPRHGKLVDHNTPVATTKGWAKHGDLKVGDRVFGLDGSPTRVVAESADDFASMRVTLADGASVVVHPEHEWTVYDRGWSGAWRTMTTREIAIRLRDGEPRGTFLLPDVVVPRRGIVSIEKVKKRPGKCIQVDRDDGLYLVGKEFIPTHNSTLTSHWLPVWYLNMFPEKRVMMASYGSKLATHWGRIVRNEIATSPYSWTTLNRDSKAASDFITPQGGGMLSVGTSGSSTGRGGDLVIADDIHKDWAEAQSANMRQSPIDFFDGTLYTRKEPNASIIVNHTRWHERDLSGYLINEHSDNWLIINMPALAENEDTDILGRKVGEALCPERYTSEDLNAIKLALGSRKFASLYQQRPSPEEGGVIKRAWFKRYIVLPAGAGDQIQTWDLSLKGESQSDYVVGQQWARSGPDRYLIEQVRAQMDFPATCNAIEGMADRHPETTAIYIEDAANGPAVMSLLRKRIPRIIAVQAKGSKYARLSAAAPYYEAGNVFHPDPAIFPWVGDLEEELVTFPNAENDDQCDAVSMAMAKYMLKSDTTSEWSM